MIKLFRWVGVALLTLFIVPTNASHLMGGEITWECLPTGQFKFYMSVYRDCNGISGPTTASLDVAGVPGVGSIPLNFLGSSDISPDCYDPNQQITCNTGGDGAVEEFLFESNPVFLNGTPPPTGWWFSWQSCCRNSAITNLQSPGSQGFTLRAGMFPYNGQNMNPCYDSSPSFLEKPNTILCTGYPFEYNNNGADPDLDSLVFSWGQPLDDYTGTFSPNGVNPANLAFQSGYSHSSPLPSSTQDPRNTAATVDPITGNVAYESYTPGNFVTVLKIESYKCGIKVAEIYREIQVILLGNCGQNTPPTVTAPFQDANGNYTEYVDTVYAGETVQFTMSGTDYETLPNGFPQTMQIQASGGQFGNNYTDPNAGCYEPPCATLNPPPPATGQIGVSTTFTWNTDCSNLSYTNGCGSTSNTYNFVIKVLDDWCPAPAINFSSITIVVLTLPVDPPTLRCANLVNGVPSLEWTPAVDTGNFFDSYHVFHSSSYDGPYTVVDSIFDISVSNVNYPSLTGGYFYVQSRNNCGSLTKPSDTISVLELQAQNLTTQVGELSWNSFSEDFTETSHLKYDIYREIPAGSGNWNLATSTLDTFYIDTLALCGEDVGYRVAVEDSSGCSSITNEMILRYEDLIAPAIVDNDFVTVDHGAGNKASIEWGQAPEPDAIGYVIYQLLGGNWVAIDTLFDPSMTVYTNANSNAGSNPETYRIAALDSCYNISPMNLEHTTMHLSNLMDPCANENLLDWNEYVNWPDSVGIYNVLVSENGGPFNLLASTAPTTTELQHNNLVTGNQYCYYIEAFNQDSTLKSYSNQFCFTAALPTPPTFDYLEYVTVLGDQVETRSFVDTAADVTKYRIERAVDQPVGYQYLGVVPVTGPQIDFTDLTAKVNEHSYYYRAIAIDTCGMPTDTSNLGRTILVHTEAQSDMTNIIEWNPYADWDAGVGYYEVYRAVQGVWDPNPIAVLSSSVNAYEDQVGEFSQTSGEFCYQIRAVEDNGNSYNLLGTSYSNEACAKQEPRIFVPNAFTPNGKNPIFKPNTTFVDPAFYKFSVFDRWGQELFYTEDPNQGWDGTFMGEELPLAVYIYYVQSQTLDGEPIEITGSITLIR